MIAIVLAQTGAGSILQRCDIETSGTSSAEKSEDKDTKTGGAHDVEEAVRPAKRPAAKAVGSRKKKKEEDEEVTQLGSCKGNQEEDPDEDADTAPAESRPKRKKKQDRDDGKKKRHQSKKESGGGKKRHGRKKEKNAAAAEDGASTSSDESQGTEKVTENMLADALKRAKEAEDKAEGRNQVRMGLASQ